MTKCDVTLCDSNFNPVRDYKIDMEAYDPAASVSIDKVANSKVSSFPEVWGGTLNVGSSDIYNVIVDTTGTSYAPSVVENLNGDKTPELDVILFTAPAPVPQWSSGPTSAADVASYVRHQDWSPVAKNAVFSSMRTYSFLRTLPPGQFSELRWHLETFLRSVHIDPDLIA